MKVLFKKHVINVWKPWEIKEVKAWYAQNFLFPHGHAVEYTAQIAKSLKTSQKKEEAHRIELIANRHEIVEKLNGQTLEFALKTWAWEKVYGWVWEKDILLQLKKKYKVELTKKHIELMDGHLKKLWEHDVYVKVWKDAMAKMKVLVTPLK